MSIGNWQPTRNAQPVIERRIGFRRTVHGIDIVLPAPAKRFGHRTPAPIVARVADLSLSGAGIIAEPLAHLPVNAKVSVELGGRTGRVIVRSNRRAPEPGLRHYGLEFIDQDLADAALELLDAPERFAQLSNTLVELLDDLARRLDRAADRGRTDPDLKLVAADLAKVVSQFEKGRANAEDILANLCWIDGAPSARADLAPVEQWAQHVNVEIAKHPFTARQDLARALCAVAADGSTSRLGAEVMRTIGESLLL